MARPLIDLFVEYRQNPSIERRNRLVELNSRLVRKIAHSFEAQCNIPYQDLEQIGFLGVIKAVERFDPKEGNAFSTFAVPCIRGEILHFLRDHAHIVRIPREWQRIHRDGAKMHDRLVFKLGRQPSDADIANALNISLSQWRTVLLAHFNRHPISLDGTVIDGEEQPITRLDLIPDGRAEMMRLSFDDRVELDHALNNIDRLTREMIEAVFLLGESRLSVSNRTGLSEVTVGRRVIKGVEELKKNLC